MFAPSTLRPFSCLALAAVLAAQEPRVPAAPFVQPDGKAPPSSASAGTADAEVPQQARRASFADQFAGRADPAAVARAAAALRGLTADDVLFDVDAEGSVVAATRRYKATFGTGSWSFFGRPAAGATRYSPIGFRLASCSIGGIAQSLVDAPAQQRARQVVLCHGACQEVLDVAPQALEQSFVFESVPLRGELRLEIATNTELRGEASGDGIRFRGEFSEVRYSEAVAIDAQGNRCRAETTFGAGRIVITVPAAFVAQAALPLVVDPWVSETAIAVDNQRYGVPDVAWDETLGVWAVCYAQDYLLFDHDCFLQRFDDSLNPIGGPLPVDVGPGSWQSPRIADNNLGSAFLVVAQVSANGIPPSWIEGRIYSGGAGLQPPFTIEREGVPGHAMGDKRNPDLGGDPASIGPTYFTVVWERVWSGTDHDVHMKQVLTNGTLRSVSPTLVDNSLQDDRSPRISNSDGPLPGSHQRFGITWQRTVSANDHDVFGSLWTWDGQPVLVAGAIPFAVATGPNDQIAPTVSSPDGTTSAQRQLLFAWEDATTNNGDLGLAVFDVSGHPVANANLSTLLVGVPLAYPHRRPVADCDGVRFGVAYLEGYQGTNDWDSYVTFVAFVGGQLVVQAEPIGLTWSQYITFDPNLASRYASTGVHSRAYATVDTEQQPIRSIVGIHRVDGYQAGWQLRPRPAGCGNLTAFANGSSVIGESFTLSLNATSGFVGFLAGDYVPAAPIPVCPNCTAVVANATTVPGPVQHVAVPLDPSFVGLEMTFQGFALSSSPAACLGAVELSNGFQITFR